MKEVFIDSDVIIDVMIDRKPFVEHSELILSRCEKSEINGFISLVTLTNIHYLAARQIGKEKSLQFIKSLLQIVTVLNSSTEIATKAAYSEFSDFEDAVQNFSAENRKSVEYIITRNVKDYKSSSLVVLTPSEFLKLTS